MSTIAKVFVVVVFALSVAFAVSSALLMTEKDTWHNKFLDLESKSSREQDKLNADLKKTQTDLQEKMGFLNKAKDDLSRLTDEKGKLEQAKAKLEADLTAKERSLNDLSTSFSSIKSDLGQLTQRNDKMQKDLTDAQAKLKDTEEALRTAKAECEKAKLDKDEAIKKLADAEARRKDVEDRLARATEALERLERQGSVKVSEILSGVQKPIDGRVLEVDPSNNVVVINVGKEQGVGLGYNFTVYRDSEYVGEIKVEQLQSDLAGASPVAGTLKSEIRKGDNVTTRIR